MFRIFPIFLILILGASAIWGELVEIGSLEGDYEDMMVVSGYAYCLVGESELKIIDISVPANPTVVGTLLLSSNTGKAWHLFMKENYIYVANGRFQVVDASNPTNPILIVSQDVIGCAMNIYVDSIYAYIVGFLPGPYGVLEILDISIPSAPSAVGSLIIPQNQFSAIYGGGNYVYIGTMAWGPTPLYAVEVVSSSAPQIIDTLYDFIVTRDIYVSGDYAYLSTDNRCHIVDISNPYNLELVGSLLSFGHRNYGIYAESSYDFVAAKAEGLKIIDISDLQNPVVIDSASTNGVSHAVCKDSEYVYLADGNSGAAGGGRFRIFKFIHSVEEKKELLSSERVVCQNYPNPFKEKTAIRYTISSQAALPSFLKIYNVIGKLIKIVELKGQKQGIFYWDGTNEGGEKVPSGIYFYQFYYDNKSSIRGSGKMSKMK